MKFIISISLALIITQNSFGKNKDKESCLKKINNKVEALCSESSLCTKEGETSTLLGIYHNGEIRTAFILHPKGVSDSLQVSPQFLSPFHQLFRGKNLTPLSLKTNRFQANSKEKKCQYQFKLKQQITSEFEIFSTKKNTNINLKTYPSTEKHLKIFGFCKKSVCSRTVNKEGHSSTLLAISDIDNDSNEEYWFTSDIFTDPYRVHEYDLKTKKMRPVPHQ